MSRPKCNNPVEKEFLYFRGFARDIVRVRRLTSAGLDPDRRRRAGSGDELGVNGVHVMGLSGAWRAPVTPVVQMHRVHSLPLTGAPGALVGSADTAATSRTARQPAVRRM
jgi:hypothetical protein